MGRPGGRRRFIVASIALLISGPLAATPVKAATPVTAATSAASKVTPPAYAAPRNPALASATGLRGAPPRPAGPWLPRGRGALAPGSTQSGGGGPALLSGLSFPDSSHGWAVGGDAVVASLLATSNGGGTWSPQAPPSNVGYLAGVQFLSPTRGWAVGFTNPSSVGGAVSGVIISTTDGGANWTAQTAPAAQSLWGVNFVSSLSGWAVGSGQGPITQQPPGVILHTPDGGTTWVQQPIPTGIGSLNSVSFSDAQHGVAVGYALAGGAAILVTSNGGTSWTSTTVPSGLYNIYSVTFLPGTTHAWAAGAGTPGGMLFASVDSGTSWNTLTTPASAQLVGVTMVDATHGWAVGSNYTSSPATILATTTGTTWTAQTAPSGTGGLEAIAAVGNTTAWAVGTGACGNPAILGTVNSGSTWTEELDQSAHVAGLTGVATPDATHVFVVGNDSCPFGVVLASSNGGAAWTQQTLPAGVGSLVAVSFVSASVGWATGEAPVYGAPTIIGTLDGGQTWTVEALPAGIGYLWGISFSNTTHGWAVGTTTGGAALVIATSNGGATWTRQTLPAGTSGGDLLGVFFLKDASHGWAVGLKSAIGVPPTPLALATINGGTTWLLQTVPASITDLSGVSFASTLTGWAVGDTQSAGAIVATTDGGATWTSQTVPPYTYHLQAVAAVTAQTAWVMGSATNGQTGGPLKTTDGGTTWVEQPISNNLATAGGSFVTTAIGWTTGIDACPDGRYYPAIYHTMDGGAAWATQYGGCPAAGSGPAISAVAPDTGPEPGGTNVLITGVRLTGATAVTFGGTPAASFHVVNDSSITAVSPAGTGTVDVRVVSPAGTSPPTVADQFTFLPAVSVLPAMTNGAYGGYVTVAYLKNTGASDARALIAYFDQTGQASGVGDRVTLPVNGQATVRQDSGNGLPASTAGSAIVYSDQPLAAFVNEFPPGAGTDATSYTATPVPTGVGSTLYAPAIANGAYGGYTTGIGLLNLGSAATDITITYRNSAGGIAQTQTLTAVPSRAYRGLYSGDATLALPAGFAGTATIQSTSTPAQPLAAVVNETGPRGQFSSYDAVSSGSTTLNAPIMLNGGYGGYYTGMGIQNTGANPGTVTVQFYDASGTHITPDVSASIAGNAYLPLYQGAASQGPPASASGYTGVLTSTVPIAAVVNEVAPPSATPTQSTSYNTFPAGAGTIHLALVENAGSDGWTTGLGVMNTGSATTHVTVTYYDATSGSALGVTQQTDLAPHAFYGPYQGAPSLLAPGQRATAVLTTSAAGTIAVVCNEQGAHALMSYSGQ